MYIKCTHARGQRYYHLVESYRQNGKVKQRVLLSLGRVENNKISHLQQVLSKYGDSLAAIHAAGSLDVKTTYILGPLLILSRLMEELGIAKAIDSIHKKHPRLQCNLYKIVFTLVASRWIQPVSKLGLYDRWLDRFYPELVDQHLPLHQLYRALDVMAEHKEEMEEFLYRWQRDLFSMQVDVVLYDLTTLRFESTREDLGTLRRFGYSKEMRSDCTQVVLGLLTDAQGSPLCFEVYPGNTFEGHTLEGIVEKMRKKFQVKRFIWVADRGLFSSDNLGCLRKEQGEFIVGLRLGKQAKKMEGLYDKGRYRWINKNLAVYETTLDGDRCIITWSAARAERDRKAREAILEKIRQKLAAKNVKVRTLVTNENYKKYVVIEGSRPVLNEQAIKEETIKDGFFGIITNVKKMKAEEIVLRYKELWRIEDAFGELKGTLMARPVFHWTDQRIVGHLMICFLAYLCEAYCTRALRKEEEKLKSKAVSKKIIRRRPLTAPMALKDLCWVVAVPVEINDKCFWVRTDIPENGNKLFRALGLKIPPKILKQEKRSVVATA